MARKSASGDSRLMDALPPPEQLSYEQATAELEEIIARIEQGEIGLEESIAAYQRGAKLIQRCREVLDAAEQRVETLTKAMEMPRESGRGRGD